jgi:hypothetical protein
MFGFSLRVLPDEPSNPTAPKGQNEVAQGQNEAPPWVRYWDRNAGFMGNLKLAEF